MVQNSNYPDFMLPDGNALVFDITTGAYYIIPAGKAKEEALAELRPKALERKLHALVVTRLKQFINVLFWGAVAFIVKLLISVADQFENYAAKDVAKNVGQTLYVVFAIAIVAALAIGIIGFFTAAGFEESRRQDSDPSQQRKKADKSRPAKPATSAQSYIK